MEKRLMDSKEAPKGYKAVLKSDFTDRGKNLCFFCDWRKECQNEETDFQLNNHRCMSFSIISFKTGLEIKRNDGCSVVFKIAT